MVAGLVVRAKILSKFLEDPTFADGFGGEVGVEANGSENKQKTDPSLSEQKY